MKYKLNQSFNLNHNLISCFLSTFNLLTKSDNSFCFLSNNSFCYLFNFGPKSKSCTLFASVCGYIRWILYMILYKPNSKAPMFFCSNSVLFYKILFFFVDSLIYYCKELTSFSKISYYFKLFIFKVG